MIKLIANEDLKADMLPSLGDPTAIFSFAMTFNGYEHFGSFEAAAENARNRARTTLDDLRNELFMSARGSRHRDDDRYLDTYCELLPLLQKALKNVHAGT